jgi:hypothetical protein
MLPCSVEKYFSYPRLGYFACVWDFYCSQYAQRRLDTSTLPPVLCLVFCMVTAEKKVAKPCLGFSIRGPNIQSGPAYQVQWYSQCIDMGEKL